MANAENNNDNSRSLRETGREYLDTAVQAVKDHPAAAAGIAAGVAAVAAGAAYGVSALRAKADGSAEEDQLIIDPQRVPETIPDGSSR